MTSLGTVGLARVGLANLGGGGGSGPVVITPLSNPAGWTSPFTTFRVSNSNSFLIGLTNLNAYKPVPVVTYYVDPAMSGNTGDGLSWATAFRDVAFAVTKADVDRIIVRAGRYYGGYGWANAVGIRSIQVEVDNNGIAYFINTGARTPNVWTLDQGTTYLSPQPSNNYMIADFGIPDSYGNPTRPLRATDLANCRATPGTLWNDGTNYYYNPAVARNLVGDTNALLVAPTNNVRWAPATTGLTLSLKNIWVIGGKTVWNDPAAAGGSNATVLFENCRFLVGHTGSQANGTNISIGGLAFALNCQAQYNEADGFNWHGYVPGTPGTPSADVYELNCIADGRNGYAGISNSTNNSTTAHESTRIQRVNGLYAKSEGRTLADIDFVKAWSLGCSYGPSLSAGAASQSVQIATSNPHYMDTCVMMHGLGAIDVSLNFSNILLLYNTSIAGLTIDNPAGIGSYVP